jgi:uncharacterized membrane protein
MDFLSQLHPKVVHYPIALFVIYALLETIGVLFKKDFFSKSAYLILFLGTLGAIAAVLTGNSAADVIHQLNKSKIIIPYSAVSEHSDYANFTIWFFSGLLVLRTFVVLKKNFLGAIRIAFVILSFIGVFLVYKTGELGGRLVYKYGAGTDFINNEVKNQPSQDGYRGKIFKGKQE